MSAPYSCQQSCASVLCASCGMAPVFTGAWPWLHAQLLSLWNAQNTEVSQLWRDGWLALLPKAHKLLRAAAHFSHAQEILESNHASVHMRHKGHQPQSFLGAMTLSLDMKQAFRLSAQRPAHASAVRGRCALWPHSSDRCMASRCVLPLGE